MVPHLRSGFARAVMVLGIALTLVAVSNPSAQPQAGAATGPSPLESLTGRDSFEFYCAPCHGSRGRGDGPTGAALITRPADLTTLTRRNDGVFPRQRVRDLIGGTAGGVLAAHGGRDMPVWGPIFRAFDADDARVGLRIDNIVSYIESLQTAVTPGVESGNGLFVTYCASCHGTNARGNGPMGDALRRTPPDLTTYTARNGGSFPAERLRQIIDGRMIPSHGSSEMPVWGDAFKSSRTGFSEEVVRARITAIVRYLEAIQVRSGD